MQVLCSFCVVKWARSEQGSPLYYHYRPLHHTEEISEEWLVSAASVYYY